MAGHNKWSKIKRQKKREDQRKGRIFGKLSREIAVAAREGGGDPEFNPRLRTAIDNAQAENMPKDNIESAIRRGLGEEEGVDYREYTLEGYGPGGAALYLQCLTDNANRTVQEIRHLLDTRGGNLGRDGSVAWMFERKGQIRVDAGRYAEEAVLEAALMAGAEDLSRSGGEFVITTAPADFHSVQDALKDAGIQFEEAELAMVPQSTMEVEDGKRDQLIDLLAELEDHDDVQKVFSNLEVDESELAGSDAA